MVHAQRVSWGPRDAAYAGAARVQGIPSGEEGKSGMSENTSDAAMAKTIRVTLIGIIIGAVSGIFIALGVASASGRGIEMDIAAMACVSIAMATLGGLIAANIGDGLSGEA